ncbi:uncharacterized protein TRIADDRAFT_56301 [Trichoplax adhaerens]|uniref:Uncharacterized protein n=1 Tax=Trichoplax adhaerens TaxID=10228 RepID=B3RXR4_TRIAD|nr:hypothetical protein TRIADDRAFT_56301 [Trichoplax adhaerens]EDV24902.1 hypothetical protein TRIADDRAFT_56301 [Trichoplax adhaerens]|eukprot:XP_002112792.1 hypothetical protein TRIADDRAFT_56301 [Trichoplax adhaerens]
MQDKDSITIKSLNSNQLATEFFRDLTQLMPTNAVINRFIHHKMIDPLTASQWKIYNQDKIKRAIHPDQNQLFLVANKDKILAHFSKFLSILDHIGICAELQRRNLQERLDTLFFTQSQACTIKDNICDHTNGTATVHALNHHYPEYNIKDQTLKWTQQMIDSDENDYDSNDMLDDDEEDNNDRAFSDSEINQLEFTSYGVRYQHRLRSHTSPYGKNVKISRDDNEYLPWYDWEEEYEKATFYFYAKLANILLPGKNLQESTSKEVKLKERTRILHELSTENHTAGVTFQNFKLCSDDQNADRGRKSKWKIKSILTAINNKAKEKRQISVANTKNKAGRLLKKNHSLKRLRKHNKLRGRTQSIDNSEMTKHYTVIGHHISKQRHLSSFKALYLSFLEPQDVCIAATRTINVDNNWPNYSSLRSSNCTSTASSEDDLFAQQEIQQDRSIDNENQQYSQSDDSCSLKLEDQSVNFEQFLFTTKESDNQSTTVWLCTKQGYIVVVDFGDKKGKCQDRFRVCTSSLLSIAAIPKYNADELLSKEGDKHYQSVENHNIEKKLAQVSSKMDRHDAKQSILLSSNDIKARLQQPCMWIGSESGWLYIYECNSSHYQLLHSLSLKDSILSLHYNQDRVFVGLVSGTLIVFERDSSGNWKFDNHDAISLGIHTIAPILCIDSCSNTLWCSCGNMLHVIRLDNMQIEASMQCHARTKHYVTNLASVGNYWWITTRRSSIIRVIHQNTYQTIKEFDIADHIEGSVAKKDWICVTAMVAHHNCLWIGTNIGSVLRLPMPSVTSPEAVTNSAAESLQFAWLKLTRVCSLRHRSAVRLLLPAYIRQSVDCKIVKADQKHNINPMQTTDVTYLHRSDSNEEDFVNRVRNKKSSSSTKTEAVMFSCGEGIEVINNDLKK